MVPTKFDQIENKNKKINEKRNESFYKLDFFKKSIPYM